ncbi:MAG TPA: VOC family protein [Anaerolineae bacterium]|nr:VOC family protein [Anaerolineae bacterium]MCB0223778.1 VOC family protein [Anaerolineae bacterium]HRV93015.1 VOC family protein [Anaerolineae bacterium]
MIMKVDRILETCLYVDDLNAAEKFYRRILGVESFSRVNNRHVFFRCGESMLLLFNPLETAKSSGDVPTHGAHGPGHVAFAIAPNQIDLCRRQLQENGIAIETEITWPSGGRSIYFRDPAGNSVELATAQVWG